MLENFLSISKNCKSKVIFQKKIIQKHVQNVKIKAISQNNKRNEKTKQ